MKRVCVDVGGTFTDCLVLDEAGDLRLFKAPTTPKDPTVGFLNAFGKAARHSGQTLRQFLGDVEMIVHGTTLATNTLLTERGAVTGMVTTQGFRDVIEIRRGIKDPRVSIYNVFIPPARPLVPRRRRLGVTERIRYDGRVLTPLKEAEVRAAAKRLKADGVQAVAVCFLSGYVNPAHEHRAAALVRHILPDAYVTTSYDTLPVWREFERFNTTVVGAYVGPAVNGYLVALERRLTTEGFKGTLLMVLANGLVQRVAQCVDRAVYLLGSGPAAAPAGALHLGRPRGQTDLLSVDMGGTSFDVGLIRQGDIPTTTESWVGDNRVAIKMVDVHSVGAGGGSIAHIDSLGLLRVGPQSAGADPGPACYGQGGTEPTVTDANLVLGYLPADYFLGGEIPLHPDKAAAAVRKVGARLGMDVPAAAEAIFTTVNAFMADAIAEVSTKRGYDVRDFTLVAGGGAGAVHAAFIADRLGIPQVLVPSVAALYSAFGMFAMDLGQDYARSFVARAGAVDVTGMNKLFAEMEGEALAGFAAIGMPRERVRLARTAEMRYVGQFHEVETEVPAGSLSAQQVDATVRSFHQQHEKLYTFSMPGKPVEFLTLRVKATVPNAPFHLRALADGPADPAAALKRRRACRFNATVVNTPIYDGDKLLAGNVIPGPAVIEETTTTVVIPAGYRCQVDRLKTYALTR
ncbi:MAG TPA: hydantoinase/oxoprolinase family protein [Candidatus Sulfotelmatobacter sp.]|nr:hydantoinase/oxoprolinase family protein [Candidatus Sulfotelmatobacter sp.]